MRTSVGWLAAAALCLGAASSVHAQGFTPFTSNGTTSKFTPFTSNGTQIAQPFASTFGGSPAAQGSSQPRFPPPGASLSGPSRLINLMPSLHNISNTHFIGYSMFPSQTDQYLAQFGFKRLR